MKIISILSVLLLSQLIHAQQGHDGIHYDDIAQGKMTATWTYTEGEQAYLINKMEIRNLLVAEVDSFENPYCLRDNLLNNPIVQANVALGAIIKKLHFKSIFVGKAKVVSFSIIWDNDNDIGGVEPVAFCKMKEQ